MLHIFIDKKKSIPLGQFEPANLGSNGKHDSHKTTGSTELTVLK
jgi:hypothetical protein